MISHHMMKSGVFSSQSVNNDLKQSMNKTYDKNFKKFFQRREVLAGILINVVPEFKNFNVSEVKERIMSSEVNPINAELFANEDVDEDQVIIYDIITTVNISSNSDVRDVHLIFDLEMQRKYNTDYNLMNRAIYYVSRIISKQKIEKARYQDLVPVQSTWICVKGVPKNLQNRQLHFEYHASDENGNLLYDIKLKGQDLVRIDFLLLSEDYNWNSNDPVVIKFLQSIFHNNMRSDVFNPYVKVSDEIDKEVLAMASEFEQYDAEMEAERRQGREEGRGEGRVKGLIEAARDFGMTSDINIINYLSEKLNINKSEATNLFNLYK